MYKKILFIISVVTIFISHQAFAILSLELTRGVAGAIPIAIVPFVADGNTPREDVSGIVTKDLQNSGRFKVYGSGQLSHFPRTLSDVKFDYFKSLGTDNVVIGNIQNIGGQYQVSFQLLDVFKGQTDPQNALILSQKFTVPEKDLRALSHHLSDIIYKKITGTPGIFSTRLAYIVVQRAPHTRTTYTLEVADYDGYNPQPLLKSTDPIMSPAWSPNGRSIAYVSFENRRASIFVQDVTSGSRRLISQFPGINGAPAWSPDGRKLALVLSKSGSPNIYIIDLGSKQLTQVTNDYSINTEPSWSPDGNSIIFTSTRSGGPQIYQKNLGSGSITRLTYDGNYNARASFAPDGNHIIMLNREASIFNVGILDLDSGNFHVLTNSGSDNESPSVAPNGSMVLYGTLSNGRNVLGMVASDSSVQLRLPARNGEVQDPAWSPFLS